MRLPNVPEDGSPLVRSVAACIAAILEADPADVPRPDGHPEPWTVWRNWLAQRGAGLVPIESPRDFDWPGPWLALLRTAGGDEVAAVAFGSPPGLAWHPLEGPETFDDVHAGCVLAPHDVGLWQQRRPATDRLAGRVEAIAIAPDAEAPMVLVQEAHAVAARGLEGDRYHAGRGTFSNPNARGIDITLAEAEALDDLALIDRAASRRNLITSGVDLNALVGRRFAVGEVECLGQRLCEPCAHLERLTRRGVLRGLAHRGGLRADVVTAGTIHVGDEIRAL